MKAHRLIPATEVKRSDETIDVLAVGAGCAGLSAMIEAARSSRALVLERAGGIGGTTALFVGVIYCSGGTAIQKEIASRSHRRHDGYEVPGLFAAWHTTAFLRTQPCIASGLPIGEGTFLSRLVGRTVAAA